ncbi:hypothetical protein PENSPDRAFT_651888 [Peniophora sp. CONT]|nr:hypothetical protein PENSPDRAFT_651888 [Peniophora sp. CONT]
MAVEGQEPASVQRNKLVRALAFLSGQLNFYRLHILYFIFTPLIFSAIFYASNGETHIRYIDALYNCVSAMVVCGLATVDLSSLTPWQQVILFIQMCIGNPIVVSWFVVYMRRRLFKKRCENIVINARSRSQYDDNEISRRPSRLGSLFRRKRGLTTVDEEEEPETPVKRSGHNTPRKTGTGVRTDMIRRMDDAPKLVNPSGWISERIMNEKQALNDPKAEQPIPSSEDSDDSTSPPTTASTIPQIVEEKEEDPEGRRDHEHSAIVGNRARSRSTASGDPRTTRFASPERDETERERVPMPRTQTIEFAPEPRIRRGSQAMTMQPTISENGYRRSASINTISSEPGTRPPAASLRTAMTYQSTLPPPGSSAKHSGFGGFPLPHEILGRVVHHLFPKVKAKLERTLTMPRTMTVTSQSGQQNVDDGATVVPYISFDAIIGRNSRFHELTNEQLEELGGVEYRALNALLWLLPLYFFGVQLIAFAVIAPYMTYTQKFQDDFRPPQQHKFISPTWFSLFQVVSAFTNTGTSLVDQSMIPFQTAYPMIFFLGWCILAGNTAFPIFLRFGIWSLHKLCPKRSSVNETLHFLLDHPRRCFIYLFPSHQTWFLFLVLVGLNLTDWVCFLLLDIGNEEIDKIPVGTRMADGMLQAYAVRAAGFATVTISGLAPAVKVLYVIMMYISVYPIAMSVRSTNVYEEQSLGIYMDENESEPQFPAGASEGQRMTVWSTYLAQHIRRQLSFDMWWLGVSLFLVCIIERHQLNDENAYYFDIFAIVFELVSAYGTVGLSLGLPFANYSLSGKLSVLSKLVVICVMIRGRHRGLPVAIDRAVVLPFEFRKAVEDSGLGVTRSETMSASGVSDTQAGAEFRRRLSQRTSSRQSGDGR